MTQVQCTAKRTRNIMNTSTTKELMLMGLLESCSCGFFYSDESDREKGGIKLRKLALIDCTDVVRSG